MGSQTAAGSTLAISVAKPATNDAAGYAALSFTEIGQVERRGRRLVAGQGQLGKHHHPGVGDPHGCSVMVAASPSRGPRAGSG